MNTTYHLLQSNDVMEHKEDIGCKCQPTSFNYENGGTLIVHNSFDGREGLKQAIEIYKKYII